MPQLIRAAVEFRIHSYLNWEPTFLPCHHAAQNSTALLMCEPTGDEPPAASWQTPITQVGSQSCRFPQVPGPGHGPPDSGGTCWLVPTPRPCHTNSRRCGGPSMVAP